VPGKANPPSPPEDHFNEYEESFNQPTDIGFGPNGEIYVTDGYGNSRVAKFDKNGKFLKSWGKKGTGPGEFNLPHSVVVDAKGLVYIADRENRRVQIFDPDGNYLREWTKFPEEGTIPTGMCITGPKERQVIYLSDLTRDRVLKMDLNGNALGAFGAFGRQPGQFNHLAAIACVPSQPNVIYIGESRNWRFQKLILQQ
jgi:DNA-binding beta-propeller fold protein YncE